MKTNKLFKPLALAAICATLFAGCATMGTNASLEAARADVNAAASNPDVVSKAPLELKTAQQALDRADRAQREHEDSVEVDHQAYLATTRARTAQDFASARRATDDLTQVQADVDKMRLAMRTREADMARAQAAQSSQQADIARAQAAQSAQATNVARADAAAANRDAAYAAQQAGVARLMADAEREKAAQARQDAMSAEERVRVLQMRISEVEARETERGLLVTLGDVLFQTGRSELQPVAAPRLDKLAGFLKQFPEKKLLIEGYTDSVGSHQLNMELSQRRAEAVKLALVQRGVDASRMTIGGYGESYPVASNQSTDGRQLNRRVEVIVSDERGNLKSRS